MYKLSFFSDIHVGEEGPLSVEIWNKREYLIDFNLKDKVVNVNLVRLWTGNKTNKTNCSMVMAIINRVWRCSYKLKNIAFKKREVFRFSKMVDGKKEFLKKLCFVLRREMLCIFRVEYDERLQKSS